ncbi:MAG: 6-phosphofructokinase [Clostridiales bacterium]|nr:6-phosphofructokinase [Clostridiales bacterium]
MKGNVIVGQSGGPTAVINSSLAGVFKTAKERGANMIYGMQHGIQGFLNGQIVNLADHIKNNLDIELLKRTPSSFLGSCRYKLPDVSENKQVYEDIFAKLNELEIAYFFYIGGNDSMDTIHKLSDYGKSINSPIRFMGVPKTIDNDLAATDHTPGFGSAAKYIASITKEVIRDGLVYDVNSVTVLEIMGRNAGWLTGAAALARGEDCEGPDMILLPEIPFDPKAFIERVKELQKTKRSVIIAVSEGIRLANGKYACEMESVAGHVDAFGHRSLSGTGRILADLVSSEVGCKARAIEFSTLQRCASHIVSRVDVTEAFQVGTAAVAAAMAGETGKMITLDRVSESPYHCNTGIFDIAEIANVEKKVPMEWIDAENYYVTQEFVNYCRPLIQAELTPVMVEGLPRHLTLETD